jgi:uncharacterized protein (TIGR02594 family)
MITEALKEFGVTEDPGKANDETILGWAKELGDKAIGWHYGEDSIPWCGLFVAIVAKRAGKDLPYGPLRAKNWAAFGKSTKTPFLGDVLVFSRNGGGHVGLYVGEDKECFHVLGGNQSDQVNITRIPKSRLFSARRTPAKSSLPPSAKPYWVNAVGQISSKEV